MGPNRLSSAALASSLLAALSGCGSSPPAQPPAPVEGAERPKPYAESALQKRLAELEPDEALPASDTQKQLAARLDAFYQRRAGQRHYVHTDKPLYQPGETIWFRVWELQTPTLMKNQAAGGATVELISPKGASVLSKRVSARGGVLTNDFAIPHGVPGGEYQLRVSSMSGGQLDHPIIVSTYQPPQIKKKLEFLRKAYGAGDVVTATLELSRGTGEALGDKAVRAIAQVDGQEHKRFEVVTSQAGQAIVRFRLPKTIRRGDGLLTILVDDAGITESIQKRIPITVKDLSLSLYPEGGDLVEGLPGRVYFHATNPMGKAADIRGRIVDDRGAIVTEVMSLHNGMGRFDLIPRAGRSYRLEVTRPAGIARTFEVPAAVDSGCSMQAVDDVHGARSDVRVGVWCTEARTVIGTASLRDKRLGDLAVKVAPGVPSVMSIPVPTGAQGAVRFTVLSDELEPLAERLIYRNRGSDLKVSLRPDRKRYTPRGEVELSVKTEDATGKPVSADLSLAVVDDTVLSFADDKTARLLARVYLEAEMPGQKVEEPNFYFGDDKLAPYALDLVLGTQGWRRFDWQPVLNPQPPVAATATPAPMAGAAVNLDEVAEEAERPMPAPPAPARFAARGDARAPRKKAKLAKRRLRGPAAEPEAKPMPRQQMRPRRELAAGDAMAAEADRDWAADDEEPMANRRVMWAPVRQFPVPNYASADDYDGPRTDFRETIYWQPSVKTDEDGEATVRFYLSDAVTSFRALAQGVSAGGSPGQGEALIQSKLPVSLAVKMPGEVSAGDRIRLPVTLSNETRGAQQATLGFEAGRAFRVVRKLPRQVELDPGERRSLFAELEVVGDGETEADGLLAVRMSARNLSDEMVKTVKVVPLGFPQMLSHSGTLKDRATHDVELSGIIPGSVDASITLYPSPVASMMKGMEAIIREPHGCFEQTSSANYPNIMVLAYLEEHEAADPAVVAKAAGMLDRGYRKLVGYETKTRGYEWFGGSPGHEALSAYGLMEFADMKGVYGGVDPEMIVRTRRWLRSRRDGKGGYQQNPRALDSFGRASKEVTDAYITYALSEAGEKDLADELAASRKLALSTRDPYLQALATGTLINLEPGAATTRKALSRLVSMQDENGAFAGADHSITRSGGQALTIETTALALSALVDAGPGHAAASMKAAKWINAQRSGTGAFSSTQATILALKALTAYSQSSRRTPADGVVKLRVNGVLAGSMRFEKGHEGALVFEKAGKLLKPGNNRVELELDSETQLPYSIAIEYRSKMPPSSRSAAVSVKTSMEKNKVPMGEGVRMNVRVDNRTDRGQPMTVARVGIPGGLRFQTWQLKELREKGIIGFYETQAREVVLYFRDMKPKARIDVPIELIAEVPGRYTAPASRAYLYYTDEHKSWTPPERIEVTH